MVYEPKAEDSLVYSPLVIDSMPISIHFNDNLQEVFKQPKDKAIHIQIAKILVDTIIVIWDTVVVDCYYKVEKRCFWDFAGHQADGKYLIIAQLSDIAGNTASDTSYFYIDTTPPQITTLQSLNPNPFTYDDPCMTFIFTTNEWTEISLKYSNLNDTTKIYERSLLFPYWDIDRNGVWDTLYIVESENWYGGYLPDGHYRAKAWAKDKAGNRIGIADFVIEDLLIVDKTRPIIRECYCQPFVVKRDSAWTTLYFSQNETEDVAENRKGLTAKIYLDTSFVCSTPDSLYDSTFDVSSLVNGPHTFRIESYDWVGNKSIYSAQFVKGSLGSEITYPAEGDSNLSGIIIIKGWASDPNLENSEPFGKYELWYKRKPEIPKAEGKSGWQAAGIWVPEGYRESNGPANRSIKEIVINSTIGYWDLWHLSNGEYILRLTTYEKGTESLSVVYRNVKVKGGAGKEIAIDTIILAVTAGNGQFPFEPLNGERLLIDYEISKSCGNVNLEIFNPRDKRVFADYAYNIVPYKGTPEIVDKEGYYFYSYQATNTVFWCKWQDLDTTDYTT